MKFKRYLMTTLIGLLLFLLTNPQKSYSQTDTLSGNFEHLLGLSIGFCDFHIQDNYLSPYIYNGLLFSSGFRYEIHSDKVLHKINLAFNTGRIKSEKQERDVMQYAASASYSILHSFKEINLITIPIKLFAGCGVSSFVTNTDMTTPPGINWYAGMEETWYWSHAINILFSGELSLMSENKIIVQFGVPVYSIVSRPDYAHYRSKRNLEVQESFFRAATKGKPDYIWENPVFFSEIEYTQELSDDFEFRGVYQFSYASVERPFNAAIYLNNILLGINLYL